MGKLNHKAYAAQKIHSFMVSSLGRALGIVVWMMSYILALMFFWASTLPAEDLVVSPTSMLIKAVICAVVAIPTTFWMIHSIFCKEVK